ncbi:MAG: glycosyltransferase [Deltaproteobacteria bacterium]|nr:glycosyltransferase [Deltaproteobacteria bacterium]
MNVLTFTTLWPNSEQPNFGVFVKQRALALDAQPGVRMRVVAPVPYFPRHLSFDFVPAHWRQMARLAERETIAGLETFHPRYFNPPKVGMRFYGRWMARGVLELIGRLHAEAPFDLIDAHYIYPDGEAAMRVGEALRVPVCVTARGTDINLFAQMPAIRPLIRRTLQRAQGIVAVSAALKEQMLELGLEAEKIAVIHNGIDREVFYPRDQLAARQKLKLAATAKIMVSVAALVPLKSIDQLIEAMQILRQAQPQARLYVIGEGPERAALTAQIAALALQANVFLVGAKPQSELADWYAAADVFCLASQREGCPNVVIKALACGTPVVARAVGGIGELVTAECGRLVAQAQAHGAGFARQLSAALSANWERQAIAVHGGARSWQQVAQELLAYYAAREILPVPAARAR